MGFGRDTGGGSGGTPATVMMTQLADVTLGVTGDTIDSGIFTKLMYLKLLIVGRCTGDVHQVLRFNGDAGANYEWRQMCLNGSDILSSGAQTEIQLVASSGGKIGTFIIEGSIINWSPTRRKHFRGYCSYTLTGGPTGHFNGTLSSAGRWTNIVDQIERIEMISIAGAGEMEDGTRMIVWGHD